VAPTQHDLDELTIWSTPLPDVQFAVSPPSADRPNPKLHGSTLFVSILSPPAVCALDAASGELIWRRELPYLASSSVDVYAGLLFAGDTQTLHALDPATGETRWEFCPYGRDGEFIYSLPAFSEDRLFLGDRGGMLHCLAVEDGHTIWKHHASEKKSVNATAAVIGNSVISSVNDGLAFACDRMRGELLWQTQLDGPCTHHLFQVGEHVVAQAKSLYFLDPASGAVTARAEFPGEDLWFSAGAGSRAVATRSAAGPIESATSTLAIVDQQGSRHETPCSLQACARYSPETGHVYSSERGGVGIRDAETAECLHSIRSADEFQHFALPEIANRRLYLLTFEGAVLALSHPAL
jgi:outer membrane protein assembly factor BamB